MPEPRALVTFTSDFGTSDPYVAAVKGVVLSICPLLRVIDVTHAVAPQAIEEAVFLTEQAWGEFPDGTVHLAVVDPGVGTERRPIAIRGPRGYAVGPDNGVLSSFLPEADRPPVAARLKLGLGAFGVPRRLPAGYSARQIGNPLLARFDRGRTFRGLGFFPPTAAHLASGFPFEDVGPEIELVLQLPPFRGIASDAGLLGRVVHCDHFGNVLTSIRGEQLPRRRVVLEIAGRRAEFVGTYGEGRGLVALVGSAGYVEMALVNGNAAAEIGARPGMEALVTAQ
jgi:S-adenosyl-L-methionine hydrolase (adenosine-forming)